MKKTILLYAFLIACGYTTIGQTAEPISRMYGRTADDSICIPRWDYDIIKGNHEEYRKYRVYWMYSDYEEQKSCNMQRERLLYAFIMAEVYKDTLAAYDFAQQIDFMKIEIDSVLGAKVIKFLDMASMSRPDVMPFSATIKLIEIYQNGLYGIQPDAEKVNYYTQLKSTIINAINERRNPRPKKDPNISQ